MLTEYNRFANARPLSDRQALEKINTIVEGGESDCETMAEMLQAIAWIVEYRLKEGRKP